MGNIISPRSPYHIVIIGLDAAGKTSIVHWLSGNKVKNPLPTLGFDIKSNKFHGYTLLTYDLGGQDKSRTHWSSYFKDVDAILFVIDVNDKLRLDMAIEALETALVAKPRVAGAPPYLSGVPVQVLLNKIDEYVKTNKDGCEHIINTITKKLNGLNELVLKIEGPKGQHEFKVGSSVATTGEGLDTAFNWFLQTLDPPKSGWFASIAAWLWGGQE